MGGGMFPLPRGSGIRIPGVAFRATVNNFFDRESVKQALSKMQYDALTKGSMRIKDHARKSIKKMGMAKPKLKVMRDNPGLDLRQLYALPGLRKHTKRAIMDRVREIKTRPPSAPGTPPHTHVPYGHMLGFRRNLWNFYDPLNGSAVVGPSQKGKMLPYLHEFGGTQRLNTYAWIPQYQQKTPPKPIIWKLGEGQRPRNSSKWLGPVGSPQTAVYPPRPFMYPAMMKAIRSGELARLFKGKFMVLQSGRGVAIRGGRP